METVNTAGAHGRSTKEQNVATDTIAAGEIHGPVIQLLLSIVNVQHVIMICVVGWTSKNWS